MYPDAPGATMTYRCSLGLSFCLETAWQRKYRTISPCSYLPNSSSNNNNNKCIFRVEPECECAFSYSKWFCIWFWHDTTNRKLNVLPVGVPRQGWAVCREHLFEVLRQHIVLAHVFHKVTLAVFWVPACRRGNDGHTHAKQNKCQEHI